jgi:16S rRNA U1498 N3-methylase RsmE
MLRAARRLPRCGERIADLAIEAALRQCGSLVIPKVGPLT